MKILPLVLVGVSCLSLCARAELKTRMVVYKDGEVALEGYSVYDDSFQGKRPGVLVVHQWKGLTDYEKRRADMLAKLGYNVFAADIYGQGVRPTTDAEAGATAGKFKQNIPLLRSRAKAALEVLSSDELTDPKKIVAIGYCFGGTAALELARSGADLAGVVSFHGGLSTPNPGDARNIKGKVLALTGGDDPLVPPKEVEAFQKEMREAKVDWQVNIYGGAVHAFTDWTVGNDNSKGVAYNEKADHRSWEAMKVFFAEVFKPTT